LSVSTIGKLIQIVETRNIKANFKMLLIMYLLKEELTMHTKVIFSHKASKAQRKNAKHFFYPACRQAGSCLCALVADCIFRSEAAANFF
jgi:hypothetical protein